MHRRFKPTRLYSIIFKRVILMCILIVVLGLGFAVFSLVGHFIDQIGASRLDILRQITSYNQVVKSVTTSVSDDLLDELGAAFERAGTETEFRGQVEAAMETAQHTFERYDMDTSIDVVFHDDNTRLSTTEEQIEPLQQLLSSYWFITLVSGHNDRSWNMRFLQSEDSTSAVLSYGRVLRDREGGAICTLITNTAQSMVFKNYAGTLRGDNRLYIFDEQGIIVSHSNPALIGFALYHVTAEDGIESNGYAVQLQRGRPILRTSYRDSSAGWTVVEELALGSLMETYGDVFAVALLSLLIALTLALGLSYIIARTITRPLVLLAKRMEQFSDEHPETMPVQHQYYEVQLLSETFNAMIGRIERLITQIKDEERAKRRIEFDFLQAQINPHFLHNTLFSIKSLIALGRMEQATTMLDAFIGLLKMPIAADRKDHALHDEIAYIRHYVALMECRYGTQFSLSVFIDQDMDSFHVPQLILQPLVENAIFHGISDKEDGEGCISIIGTRHGNKTILRVEDNGEGMTEEQISHMWDSTRRSRGSINSISLRNVRSRIQYVFGPQSDIHIESALGKGTAITIIIIGRNQEEDDR